MRFWKPIDCPSNIVNNGFVEDFSEIANVPPTTIVGGVWIHDSGVLVLLYGSITKRFLVCSLPCSFHESVLFDLIPFFCFGRVLHNSKSSRFHWMTIKRTFASTSQSVRSGTEIGEAHFIAIRRSCGSHRLIHAHRRHHRSPTTNIVNSANSFWTRTGIQR
jgi:hypothetical protein